MCAILLSEEAKASWQSHSGDLFSSLKDLLPQSCHLRHRDKFLGSVFRARCLIHREFSESENLNFPKRMRLEEEEGENKNSHFEKEFT